MKSEVEYRTQPIHQELPGGGFSPIWILDIGASLDPEEELNSKCNVHRDCRGHFHSGEVGEKSGPLTTDST